MSAKTQRLAYIDWLRGLACVAMFQTHCYDAWLSPPARGTAFFWWSQFGGSLPAPLFLFLAGISVAFVTDRMRQNGIVAGQIARTTMLRGMEVFALGILFRLQEFLLGFPWAPWTDLLRVDVLNVIGVSLVLAGALCGIGALIAGTARPGAESPESFAARLRRSSATLALLVAAVIVAVTPPLWTTHRPRWLPWYLETYVNGVHTFDKPQPWLFPLFPWAAFTCIGLAVGFLLISPWARRREWSVLAATGAAGALLLGVTAWLGEHLFSRVYAVYDFWHSSPNFFLERVGVLLMLLPLSYAWCHWTSAQSAFRPMIELGQASLLVYWVHIEFVYGRFSILTKGAQSIGAATAGLLMISAAMVVLAMIRNRMRGQGLRALMSWRSAQRATV